MYLQLKCIGTGDAFGSGGRLQPCFLIRDIPQDGGKQKLTISLDFGLSSLIGLRDQGIEPNSIGTIILSHLHGDHCGGVPFLLMDAMLGSKRTSSLTIIGPEGTESHLKELQENLFPGSHVMKPGFPVIYHELKPKGHYESDLFSLDVISARHTETTNPLSLRLIVNDKVIVYTGDGEITDELIELSEGANLLVTECYFFDKKVKWHMNYPETKRLNADLKILTHMHSTMLERTNDIPELCAYDGMELVF